jgi:hypothetical protein
MDEGVASTKLLGIKYNLDDMKKATEEAQTTLNVAKSTLSKLQQEDMPITKVVCDPRSLTNLLF